MEFVVIVEPDEVGRKRLEGTFQSEKPSFSYKITEKPEEALDILEQQKVDVLVCETSLSVLSGREFFSMAKMTAYGSSYFFSAVADVVTETASANRRQTSMGNLKFP